MSEGRAVVVVAAACVALALAGVAAALGSSEPRLAGTNDLRAFHPVAIPGGATLCQGPELVPDDSGAMRFVVDRTGGAGPRLAVGVREGARTVARGGLAGGYGDGVVAAELSGVSDALRADRVCIANRGEREIEIHGETFPREQAARVDGSPSDGRVRLEWRRPGSESWFELAPAVLDRFGLGKAGWLGSWTLILAGALVLLSWASALVLVAGGRRR